MSLDEESDIDMADLLLINILKSREDAVSTSELWAILKETCVAVRYFLGIIENTNLKIDINCLMIDASGNIQINIDPNNLCYKNDTNYSNSMLINSVGETMLHIMTNYSNIDKSDNLYQYINQLITTKSNEDYDVSKIELFADRQLNGSSASSSIDEFAYLKNSEGISSALQDSFFSTELSLNSEPDSDSDQSLCLTKEPDTASFISRSGSCIDSEQGFLNLNQLWNHCLERILSSDQECLVFIYAILKETSNNLLNENNSKKCLCLSSESIFLNQKGNILLRFASDLCQFCNEENQNLNFFDIKYINKVGQLLYEVTRSDQRISLSSYLSLMLQRMIDCKDMVINDVLLFCKTHITLHDINCRSILTRLFERWNYGYEVHQHYLAKLKHPFLYDLSTKNLNQYLKNVTTKSPISVLEIFQKNSSWLNGLKYVTKLSKSRKVVNKTTTFPRDFVQIRHPSAFQPYQPPINSRNSTLINSLKPSRLKETTHFKPLVLTSECNSVYQSKDNILSPIDVIPQYSKHTQCSFHHKYESQLKYRQTSQSASHLATDDVATFVNRVTLKHQLSLSRSINNKSQPSHSLTAANSTRSLKVNTIIDIIQSNITVHFDSLDHMVNDRHILAIADFALSLETLTENVFSEAIKQRFSYILWSDESLKLLYNTINGSSGTVIKHTDSLIIIANNNIEKSEQESPFDEKDSEKFFIESEDDSFLKNSEISEHGNDDFSTVDNEGLASDNNSDVEVKVIPRPPRHAKTASVSVTKTRNESFYDGTLSVASTRHFSETPTISLIKNQQVQIQKHLEDTSFYEVMYPSTLLCFPATAAIFSPDRNPIIDFSVNANNIQDMINKFFNLNQSIQFQFKELSKTFDLIGKCREINGKKLKKQYMNDKNDLQQNLESLFINQMELESLVVEYHSVSIDPILEEIKSHCLNQSIRFANEVRNFRNLQMIQPYAVVACLFCKGAVTSGLVYEFFLIYREFYSPVTFASTLSSVFISLQRRLVNQYWQLINAKLRLFFIILCWIEGFYNVDFTEIVLNKVMHMVRKYLAPYLRNSEKIIESTLARARNEKVGPLMFQFTSVRDGNYSKIDLIRNIDIQNVVNSLEKERKDKQKLHFWLNINLEKNAKISVNRDVFSILDISPKDLAICFTLIEQNLFNHLHPCHLLLYINSLSCTNDSILHTIKLHRFPTHSPVSDEPDHKEVLSSLRLSGKITHWAISEILRTTNVKLQGKIVKILIVTCIWCVELNNYATAISILEAIHSNTLKWAPFWNNVKPKTMKILKELDDLTNQFLRNASNFSTNDKRLKNSFLSGSPFIPCVHAMIVNLKLTLVGKCITKDECLKWSKLKKISDILDQIRLYLQFKYISNNSEINELKMRLLARIDHLTSISLDILQSHNMLAQDS